MKLLAVYEADEPERVTPYQRVDDPATGKVYDDPGVWRKG